MTIIPVVHDAFFSVHGPHLPATVPRQLVVFSRPDPFVRPLSLFLLFDSRSQWGAWSVPAPFLPKSAANLSRPPPYLLASQNVTRSTDVHHRISNLTAIDPDLGFQNQVVKNLP